MIPTVAGISGPWSLWAPSFGKSAIDFKRMHAQTLAVGDTVLALDDLSRETIAGSYPAERAARAGGAGRRSTRGEDGTWRYDGAATTVFDAFMRQLQSDVLADDLGSRYYDGDLRLGPVFAPGYYHLYSTLLVLVEPGQSLAGLERLLDRPTVLVAVIFHALRGESLARTIGHSL